MSLEEILTNVLLMLFCYGYIGVVIFVSGKIDKILNISQKTARKFLHVMIGLSCLLGRVVSFLLFFRCSR